MKKPVHIVRGFDDKQRLIAILRFVRGRGWLLFEPDNETSIEGGPWPDKDSGLTFAANSKLLRSK